MNHYLVFVYGVCFALIGGALCLVLNGGGKFSIDHLIHRSYFSSV